MDNNHIAMSALSPTSEKDLWKHRPTAARLRRAEELFKFSVKDRRALFGDSNRELHRAGLCDGQICIQHKFLPGRKGCYCKFTAHTHPNRVFYRDKHVANCSLNGENDTPEFACPSFKANPDKQADRALPSYRRKVYGRLVI